jgi:multidrug efflux pump subunit AcrA (membrane-fusion protein)
MRAPFSLSPFLRGLAVSFVVLLSTTSCSKSEPTLAPKTGRAFRVTTTAVTAQPITYSVDAIGSLEPLQVVVVPARVEGALDRLDFDVGSVVTPDTVLAVVDERRYSLVVLVAKAAVAEAEAAAKQAEAAAASAAARTTRSKAQLENAGLDYDRWKALQEKNAGYVTDEKLLGLDALVKSLRASVDEMTAGEGEAAAKVHETAAAVESRRAAVAIATKNVEDTRVRSPIAGIVEKRHVAAGQYVKVGDPVATLIDVGKLRLLRDPNQEIAEIAALALGVLGAAENVALLEGLLHDDARGRDAVGAHEVPMRTRSFAAYALGILGQRTQAQRTRQMVVRALTDELARREGNATDTRAACIIALGLVPLEIEREASASAPWISRQTELRFVQELAADPQTRPLLAAHAATALAELAADSTPALEEAAADLLASLLHREASEAALRESCLMGLGRLCDDDQDPIDKRLRAELRRTLAGGSTSERAFALMSLSEGAARRGSGLEPGSALPECREVLIEELAHGKSRTRAWAALALGVLESRLQHRGAQASPAAHEALRRAFANAAGPDESGACAIALGLAGDADGASALGERLAGAGDDVLRGYFALGIGLSGNRSLADGVRTTSAGARYRPFLLEQCAIALALLGDKNLAPELTQELRTATGQASQSWLAQALGMVGDSRSVPVLVEMVRDKGLTDMARGNLTSALGIVCDKDEMPWYHALSSRVNWRAATSTLIAGNGTGVLEIL